jgi:hypothetical protein
VAEIGADLAVVIRDVSREPLKDGGGSGFSGKELLAKGGNGHWKFEI